MIDNGEAAPLYSTVTPSEAEGSYQFGKILRHFVPQNDLNLHRRAVACCRRLKSDICRLTCHLERNGVKPKGLARGLIPIVIPSLPRDLTNAERFFTSFRMTYNFTAGASRPPYNANTGHPELVEGSCRGVLITHYEL